MQLLLFMNYQGSAAAFSSEHDEGKMSSENEAVLTAKVAELQGRLHHSQEKLATAIEDAEALEGQLEEMRAQVDGVQAEVSSPLPFALRFWDQSFPEQVKSECGLRFTGLITWDRFFCRILS